MRGLLDAARAAMLPCASLWAVACGPGGVLPCGGVWSRAMRVEGRRRPKKRWVEARGREGKRAIKNLRLTGSLKKSARPPLSTTPYSIYLSLSVCLILHPIRPDFRRGAKSACGGSRRNAGSTRSAPTAIPPRAGGAVVRGRAHGTRVNATYTRMCACECGNDRRRCASNGHRWGKVKRHHYFKVILPFTQPDGRVGRRAGGAEVIGPGCSHREFILLRQRRSMK